MFKDINQVKENAILNQKEEEIILSKEKPITLVRSNSNLSSYIAPNIDRIGCFIAYTPLHILLFDNLKKSNCCDKCKFIW